MGLVMEANGSERTTLMLSQRFGEWLSKNFVLQGLVAFSGAKAYIRYVKVLKKHHNAAGRTFCDAIINI
jgi:hypothetical protein